MTHVYHPEALDEFEAAAKYYADKQPGLESRFVECVEAAVDQICDAPTRWPMFEPPIRRRIVRVFPYSVLYADEGSSILILAIMHHSQKPGYWRTRLG